MVTGWRGGAHLTGFRGLLNIHILHERGDLNGLCDGAHVLHLVGDVVEIVERVHRAPRIGGGVGGGAGGQDGRGMRTGGQHWCVRGYVVVHEVGRGFLL